MKGMKKIVGCLVGVLLAAEAWDKRNFNTRFACLYAGRQSSHRTATQPE